MTWTVPEVTLEAHYMSNHAPDVLTLFCQSVSSMPGRYAESKGADGSIMRSELESPSLLLNGTDLKLLNATTWQPNCLRFKDTGTGQWQEFGVQRDIRDVGIAKFSLHG